jgi:hypothetical protein
MSARISHSARTADAAGPQPGDRERVPEGERQRPVARHGGEELLGGLPAPQAGQGVLGGPALVHAEAAPALHELVADPGREPGHEAQRERQGAAAQEEQAIARQLVEQPHAQHREHAEPEPQREAGGGAQREAEPRPPPALPLLLEHQQHDEERQRVGLDVRAVQRARAHRVARRREGQQRRADPRGAGARVALQHEEQEQHAGQADGQGHQAQRVQLHAQDRVRDGRQQRHDQ